MNIFKKLAGDTLIYGLGTILPKLLNFSILTIYYTRKFSVGNFGILQELYAYVLFINVLLTFGLETGFFRFTPKEKRANQVYSNAMIFVISMSLLFLVFVISCIDSVSIKIKYTENPQFIIWMAAIIVVDAICALPFAYLRYNDKGLKFSVLRLISVSTNIVLVVIFFQFINDKIDSQGNISNILGNENIGFVLLSNLLSSVIVLLLLSNEIFKIRIKLFSYSVLKPLLIYSIPLVISGFAGMINEALDRVLMKHTLSAEHLGMYSANYKIAVILTLVIQMYRYAVEPFFFKYYGANDDNKIYSKLMTIFIAGCLTVMLIIILFIDYFKFFIDPKFFEALNIVEIVLFAYLFYGIFFNLSIWYKLKNVTIFGLLLTGCGALITLYFNIWLVPKYGYTLAAYGHLVSMMVMVIVSYVLSRYYMPIKYNMIRILEYLGVFMSIYIINKIVYIHEIWFHLIQLIIVLLFIIYILQREKFLIPIINYAKSKSGK